MRGRREAGFNLIELAVVVVVVALAMVTLFRSYHSGITRAVAGAAGAKGKDIYVALSAACSELGAAPDAWMSPLGSAPGAAHLRAAGYPTSTAFFRHLVEEDLCKGLGYDSFVAGGVPVGRHGSFTATNNIWTLAADMPPGAPDALPLLLTRNVDLAPLTGASRAEAESLALGVDAAWGAPLHGWGFVAVRKDGSIALGRFKGATYGRLFSSGHSSNGCARAAWPTYLTPTRAITPGG
jgi:hypothetical protein